MTEAVKGWSKGLFSHMVFQQTTDQPVHFQTWQAEKAKCLWRRRRSHSNTVLGSGCYNSALKTHHLYYFVQNTTSVKQASFCSSMSFLVCFPLCWFVQKSQRTDMCTMPSADSHHCLGREIPIEAQNCRCIKARRTRANLATISPKARTKGHDIHTPSGNSFLRGQSRHGLALHYSNYSWAVQFSFLSG